MISNKAFPNTSREILGVRPLVVGAAYCESFEFLTPPSWDMFKARVELFHALPLDPDEWRGGKLQKLGEGHWRATRK